MLIATLCYSGPRLSVLPHRPNVILSSESDAGVEVPSSLENSNKPQFRQLTLDTFFLPPQVPIMKITTATGQEVTQPFPRAQHSTIHTFLSKFTQSRSLCSVTRSNKRGKCIRNRETIHPNASRDTSPPDIRTHRSAVGTFTERRPATFEASNETRL